MHRHIPFTDEEMDLLWQHAEDKMFVDVLLIQCYSGWRPQELGLLELKNVDLENWTFRGGIKTDAGIDRVVPIHSKIRHIWLSENIKRRRSLEVCICSTMLIRMLAAKTLRSLMLDTKKASA